MNRLTNKEYCRCEDFIFSLGNAWVTTKKNDRAIYEKLKSLEDIEEELGIDLITLIKALNGLYYKIRLEDRKISKMKVPMLRIIDGEYCWICPKWMTTTWMSVKVKDYGKTWALTRTELEDEI